MRKTPDYNDAFYGLVTVLKNSYDEREAAAIAHEAMEQVTGLGKLDRILNKARQLTEAQSRQYEAIKAALAAGKPLQYATGKAWFLNRPFMVNSHVLIPRPETEELVSWIAGDHFKAAQELHILDIGTGSGCIPISLKLVLPGAEISGCDISDEALAVARENAKALNADVNFFHCNILDSAESDLLPVYDIIVSNPPYVPAKEIAEIADHVKNHEPHLALFVPDEDPLLFYRTIAAFGKMHLGRNGSVYCELHPEHAVGCRAVFESHGYSHVAVRKDMSGNLRMLKAGL